MIFLCTTCREKFETKTNTKLKVPQAFNFKVEVCSSCFRELSGDSYSIFTNPILLEEDFYPTHLGFFLEDIRPFFYITTNKKKEFREKLKKYLLKCASQQKYKSLKNFAFDFLEHIEEISFQDDLASHRIITVSANGDIQFDTSLKV